MSYVVATDVGGTCTDTVVVSSDGALTIGKVLSTPPDFATGVIDSVRAAADNLGLSLGELLADTSLFVHGSTVVDNTLLTGDGARTGLITTAGFEDTLRVTRGAYGRWSGLPEDQIKHPVATERPRPLVDQRSIRGVPERVDYEGKVVQPLDVEATEAAIRALVDEHEVEAIAVCLLWSFRNPSHEQAIAQMIERVAPEVYVSLSSDIAPLPGEYERTSTTAINANAGKRTQEYVRTLQTSLTDEGYDGPVLVMQGYGGLLPATQAADRAVGMIECGPVAGLIGSRFLGELLDQPDVIAVDMGGTTSKVGVLQDGRLDFASEPMVNRYHYLAPKIEVVSIGAGGGSVISLEEGSLAPRIGPRSAGSRPGPVCYGLGGTEPTLTDVMVLLGYMDPDQFLGGSLRLDADACRTVFAEQIAEPLGMSVEEAAAGIYRVACSQMSDLIHEITVERGLDPRDFVLHAYGGTCSMLAGVFAEELNVAKVLIPYSASVNCAFGLAASDIAHELGVTRLVELPSPAADLNVVFDPLMVSGEKALREAGFGPDRSQLQRAVGMRYSLQVHELIVPVPGTDPLTDDALTQLVADFERAYEQRYGPGSAHKDAGIEITQFRVTATGQLDRPAMRPEAAAGTEAADALLGGRPIFSEADDRMVDADIYAFDRLGPGTTIAGPAVIHTPVTTVVLQSGHTATMDAHRNLEVTFA